MSDICQVLSHFLKTIKIRSSVRDAMLKNKRHEEILEILKHEGFISVKELGERLFASQPTIRRDLDFLEKEGMVRRNHGGVILAGDSVNAPISYRRGKHFKEKNRIARLAATLIENDQLIFIDGSTTALCLSEYIGKAEGVSVVTNGIPICQALAKQNIRVFSTGGKLVGDSLAFAGRVAERAVAGFNADLMFFSSSSLDDCGVISDYAEEETALRLAMKERSRKTVCLFDSAKFGMRSPFCLFELRQVDYVVTDEPLSDLILEKQQLKLLKEDGGAFMYCRDV